MNASDELTAARPDHPAPSVSFEGAGPGPPPPPEPASWRIALWMLILLSVTLGVCMALTLVAIRRSQADLASAAALIERLLLLVLPLVSLAVGYYLGERAGRGR